ncbi:MAG: carbohydrate binding family 9 domain-containing protein [Acidobacteria bacterium]|nr:carbohydrate binding family 9 domain-containing protein [Acidobacteriota bacterium]
MGYSQDEHAHGAAAEPIEAADVRAIRTTHGLKTAMALRIDEVPIVVDGRLDEPVWQEARVNLGFLQRDPQEGEPSTENTEFRLLFDQKNFYIGVICYDSEPEQIIATERQRDSRMRNDDTIALLFDTFHDHRNFFLFQTNPLGTQHDAVDTDEGRDHSVGWDTVWDVKAQIIPEVGWTAEFAIPFKSLRLAGTEEQTWGLDVERIIRRKNEFSHWTNFKRDFKPESISQGGHLHGIGDIDAGFRLRVKPFSVAGFTRSSNRTSADTDHAMDSGLEIMKIRVTPGLMADFIANSNFVEAQADRTQVNMDRWDLFYPEQREFFQEAGVFQFGVARGEMPAPDVALFHTRQIGVFSKRVGVASQQIPVPITAGTRLTGKIQGFTVGLMNVQTGAVASENVPQSNYGVYRIKREIFGRSAVGGYFLNREIAGTGDYNRVYGFDTNFILKEHFFANALYARSLQPGVNKDNWTSSGGARWQTDFMLAGVEYLLLDPNFRDDLGFIPRTNQRRFTPILEFNPRFARLEKVVRRLHYYSRVDYITDQEYTLQTRRQHFHFDILLQSGALISVFHHREFERINDPFELRPGVTIPAGGYNMRNFSIGYGLNPARRISGSFRYIPIWGHLGGDVHRFVFSPQIKLLQGLTLAPSYNINKATYPSGSFTDHVVNTGIEYAFNNQWLTSTILRYNNTDSFFGVQFRLNYIFRPGDDFFLVYSLGQATGGTRLGQTDQTLAAKLTYSFDY